VPEPAQLALNSDYAPATLLPRQAKDQSDQFVRHRRAPRQHRLVPFRRDQGAVPAQQRARRHDPMGAQPPWQDPGEGREHGSVTHDSFGLGFVRCSTATSCRSARISASLDAEDRVSSASQEIAVTSSR
jgi:hypothetical protein